MLSKAAQEFRESFKAAQAKAQGVEVTPITDPARLLGPGVEDEETEEL